MQKPTIYALGALAILLAGAALISSTSKMPTSFSPNAPVNATTTSVTGIASSLPILFNFQNGRSSQMPDFAGITKWWNTPNGVPLTPASLKGKVVLIDFWTYSCINCIRTFPFVQNMVKKYSDKGLVVVGVHTPEFAFEGEPDNVAAEIKKNGFTHPIALDANYGTWNAYNNQYWPAEYFFDRQGQLRHTHFGEGNYDENEQIIRELLEEQPGVQLDAMGAPVTSTDLSKIETPETYFGLAREAGFIANLGTDGKDKFYNCALGPPPGPDQWDLCGTWMFDQSYVEAKSTNAALTFSVQADKLHLVLDSADGSDKTVSVYVDGVKVQDLIVNRSTLYTAASFPDAKRHIVELRVLSPGVRFYSATFS